MTLKCLQLLEYYLETVVCLFLLFLTENRSASCCKSCLCICIIFTLFLSPLFMKMDWFLECVPNNSKLSSIMLSRSRGMESCNWGANPCG